MNWNITKGILEDAAAIAQFQLDMAMESEGTLLDYALILKGVTLGLQDEKKGTYYIARDEEGKPLGSLLLTREWSDWTCTWYWWIQSVYVKPEYRGKGIYTALYHTIKKLAHENNVRTIRLYVDRTNGPALHRYSKLGMHESHYLMYEEDI